MQFDDPHRWMDSMAIGVGINTDGLWSVGPRYEDVERFTPHGAAVLHPDLPPLEPELYMPHPSDAVTYSSGQYAVARIERDRITRERQMMDDRQSRLEAEMAQMSLRARADPRPAPAVGHADAQHRSHDRRATFDPAPAPVPMGYGPGPAGPSGVPRARRASDEASDERWRRTSLESYEVSRCTCAGARHCVLALWDIRPPLSTITLPYRTTTVPMPYPTTTPFVPTGNPFPTLHRTSLP
jgi:hypothetical protein